MNSLIVPVNLGCVVDVCDPRAGAHGSGEVVADGVAECEDGVADGSDGELETLHGSFCKNKITSFHKHNTASVRTFGPDNIGCPRFAYQT